VRADARGIDDGVRAGTPEFGEVLGLRDCGIDILLRV
jgi:hypothetical protein